MNTGRPKGNQKHLDLSARIIIEQHLNNGDSFRSIAIELSKDPSTISKEVRRHSIIRERSTDAFAPIPCANNYDSSKPRTNICNVMHMCGDNECRRKCVLCRKFRCSDVCKFYKPRECEKLNKPPYVCNGCSKRTNCMMDKKIYSSKYAQDSYEALRTTSREGINQTPESIQKLDNLLSPLLKKGQSIAHIYASHADEIACSRRTIYSYIDRGVFQARNIDLRRKVVYKQRKRKTTASLKDRSFRKDRSYKEFLESLVPFVADEIKNGRNLHFNLLTDRLSLTKMNNCGAADETLTYNVDGKFYICPAYCNVEENSSVGDLETGLDIKNPQLYKLGYAPICRMCDAYQCHRCIWLNNKTTLEVNTPSHEQCVVSHIERNASKMLLNELKGYPGFDNLSDIKKISYLDPFDLIEIPCAHH